MRQVKSMVLVPYPAHGHITPMLRVARALRSLGIKSIVALPDFMHGNYSSTDDEVIIEPIPSGFKEKDDAKDFFSIDASMEKIMPGNLERIVRDIDFGGGVACLVVDLLASWAVGVGERCGVPVAGFWPAMFATYRLVLAIPDLLLKGFISECGIPILHRRHCCRRHHHHHQINQDILLEQDFLISNQAKLTTKELPWLVGEPSSQKARFAFWLRVINRTKSLPWILINSFPKEDDNMITILSSLLSNHQLQTFHVGPLLSINDGRILKSNNNKEEHDESIIHWLDKQEPYTVIYISFGTWVGPIAKDMITELAIALEETKRPFLWVLKEEKQWREGLPEGYLVRNAEKGKVVAWAPQEEVLKFQAVGCYLSHCGWNSTMEAIRHEKRLLCYPISGDQFVTCNYIVLVWGIGIKLEVLERRVILDGIEKIMSGREGEMIQKNVSKMKVRVMGNEEICAAASNLESFVEIVRHANCR